MKYRKLKWGIKMIKKRNGLRFETLQLHVGQEVADAATGARCVPIYQTASFVFENCEQAAGRFNLTEGGNIYTRIMNPTTNVFEERIAALEGGIGALALSSGAAAISYAIQNITHSGDHIVSSKSIYGGTYNLFDNTFKNFGIATTFVDCDDLKEVQLAIRKNTKAIFVESLGNPNSSIVDIEKLAEIAHNNGIPLIVDNTFATPYLLRPIEYGADIVVHSATKFIGGHGNSIGGVVIDSGKFDWKESGKFSCLTEAEASYHGVKFVDAVGNLAYIIRMRVILLRDTGAALSPMNSFLFLQGLETLSLRVERHISNSIKVVEFLSKHPRVVKVNHPSAIGNKYNNLYKKYFPNGGGSIFTFEIRGSEKDAHEFIDKLEIFSLLANVADLKSLVIHPATTTHSQMSEEDLIECGINKNTIRLSIGTEHIDDIIEDLEQALA